MTIQRARAAQKAGNPGPEGSVGKLAPAELNKRIWECGMDVIGADSLVYEAGYERRRPSGESHANEARDRQVPVPALARELDRRRARPRSCATSSASACSVCPASPARTKTCRGATSAAALSSSWTSRSRKSTRSCGRPSADSSRRNRAKPPVRAAMETERGYEARVWDASGDPRWRSRGWSYPSDTAERASDPSELAIVMEEMGRVLFCGPYLSTAVLAVGVLHDDRGRRGPEQSFFPRSPRGRRSSRWRRRTTTAAARRSPAGARGCAMARAGGSTAWRTSSLDGHSADVMLVVAPRRRRGSGSSASRAARRGSTGASCRRSTSRESSRGSCFRDAGDDGSRPATSTAALERVLALAVDGARRRAGRRRAALPRDGDRVRQDASAVRPADRLLSGHQAQVRRHARRGRVRALRRVPRGVPRRGSRRGDCSSPRTWRSPTARRRTSTPPRRRSRSTAAWASRGSTPRTSTSSARKRARFSSATRSTQRQKLAARLGI